MKNLIRKYKKLEDNNDHNEAAMLLIKTFGKQAEIDKMEKIMYNHEKRGHILQEEIDERRNMAHKYYILMHKAKPF